jgi:hypothetical protein
VEVVVAAPDKNPLKVARNETIANTSLEGTQRHITKYDNTKPGQDHREIKQKRVEAKEYNEYELTNLARCNSFV